MRNIFIVTLGAREVQFLEANLKNEGFIIPQNDKGWLTHPNSHTIKLQIYRNDNFPDYFCCQYPRSDGKVILDHWDRFQHVVEFPLIQHALDSLIKDYPIHQVILIFTDQEDLNISNPQHERNFLRDTVYLRDILRKDLRSKFPYLPNDPDADIQIREKATNIDFQYKYFAEKCKSLFENEKEIQQIFLLAQGGIDQINHALTLQLIQAFGLKVKLWQQAEGDEPKEIFFPFLFLEDFEKARIKELLANYDFKGISIVCTDPQIKYLATIGDSLMTFRPKSIETSLMQTINLIQESIPSFLQRKLLLSL
ncbi:MAG: hypothetical protein V1733_10750 [bacterium]